MLPGTPLTETAHFTDVDALKLYEMTVVFLESNTLRYSASEWVPPSWSYRMSALLGS